jgi:hypothetical protein
MLGSAVQALKIATSRALLRMIGKSGRQIAAWIAASN